MAGHSKFKNIQHRKGAQDAKRAKQFTKLIREITTAVRQGQPDPNFNPRLRAGIATARAANLPKDRIEAAIKKGSSSHEGDNFTEIRYEGYAPGGVALIVETLTDNKNRTASDVKVCFSKNDGHLGEPGSVSFMFDRVGLIRFEREGLNEDSVLSEAIEAGADDCESEDDVHEITCAPDQFNEVRDHLAKKFGDPDLARLSWKPKNIVEVTDVEIAETLLKLVDALEDNDDVQYVCGNYVIADSIADKIKF
jgi:YebC/PmpR family DNA-binding regulatory protein